MKKRGFLAPALVWITFVMVTTGCARAIRDGVSIGVTDGLSDAIASLVSDLVGSISGNAE